ncbi:hypothetical protein [Comamonas sp.]|uniref:hypothetical protein n=1 Tax=Comamonas sp. TaxID=34028 RepID=UPI0025855625|nr:hypothetical protein [Comamonas sp.]
MLADHEIDWLVATLVGTAEAMGGEISENTAAIMAADLSAFSKPQLQQALHRVRMESTGKLNTKIILDQLDAAYGRPGADEAWALALNARDERVTVIWNNEIQEAWAAVGSMVHGKDQVGARMAFKDAYHRVVLNARGEQRVPQPVVAIGYDKAQRLSVVTEAFAQGRIGIALAQDALDGCAELTFTRSGTPQFAALPVARGLPQLPISDAQPLLALAGPAGGEQVAQAATALVPAKVAQAIQEGLERGRAAVNKKKRRAKAIERLQRIIFKKRQREAALAVESYMAQEAVQ